MLNREQRRQDRGESTIPTPMMTQRVYYPENDTSKCLCHHGSNQIMIDSYSEYLRVSNRKVGGHQETENYDPTGGFNREWDVRSAITSFKPIQ